MNRRHFLISATAAAAGISMMNQFSNQAFAQTISVPEKLKDNSLHIEIIKSAILAPSSHNTQPWKFELKEKAITIFPDYNRRCPAVDPDDHHLFVSLGCALENLTQAAMANGMIAESFIEPIDNKKIEVKLSSTKPVQSNLFQAIPTRQCTRTEYDAQLLTNEELATLAKVGTGKGINCLMLTEKSALEKILEFVVEGNSKQINDPAFFNELKTWVRFNKQQAEMDGDGLYSATSGSPNIPTFLGKLIFSTVFNEKSENDKYSKQVRSSAGIAVFSSEKNDVAHWIEAGRCFERFALQATAMNVRTAMLNQPVEVPTIRPVFASYLGLGNNRPDLVVRFGRGPMAPKSFRRKLETVLI